MTHVNHYDPRETSPSLDVSNSQQLSAKETNEIVDALVRLGPGVGAKTAGNLAQSVAGREITSKQVQHLQAKAGKVIEGEKTAKALNVLAISACALTPHDVTLNGGTLHIRAV